MASFAFCYFVWFCFFLYDFFALSFSAFNFVTFCDRPFFRFATVVPAVHDFVVLRFLTRFSIVLFFLFTFAFSFFFDP